MGNPFEEIIENSNDRFDQLQDSITKLSNLVQQVLNNKGYSVVDLAAKTSTSPQTIRKLILKGELKAKRFGRKYIIPYADFEEACIKVKTMKHQR